jgi:hypothetical protein
MLKLQACKQVDEVEARRETPVTVCGIVARVRQPEVGIAGNQKISGD